PCLSTPSLHDALPIFLGLKPFDGLGDVANRALVEEGPPGLLVMDEARRFRDPDALAGLVAINLGNEVLDRAMPSQNRAELVAPLDRKSTRLNSSHVKI